jgi:DnaB-like helicase N terminal domain/AAA domain
MDAVDPWADEPDEGTVHPVIAAEQGVLGAMLWSATAIEAAVEIIEPRDFLRPAHQVIAHRIVTMHASGEPVDPITLAGELRRDGDLARIGGGPYLHTLYATVTTPGTVAHHARLVSEHAIRRRVIEAGTRMAQRAHDPGTAPADIIARAERDLAEVALSTADSGDDSIDIGEFCAAEFAKAAPVIPGLLHASERVIVVAGEGIGKSTLARQVWVMTAAGLHPFTGTPIPPMRTLLVDLENPPSIVQGKTRPLLDLARQQPGWDDGRARIYALPGGIDVRQAADAQRLASVIKRAAPDLVIAGPLYKMTIDGGERAEQLHSAVAAFWDRMRERYGVALWLEAHAPMAQNGTPRDLRPLGSGVWQRWPEFGKTLRASSGNPNELIIGRYRGDRDERQWPERLTRPAWGESWRWPWKAEYPKGTFGAEKAA